MVVRDHGRQSDTRADQVVTHDSLESGLSTFEVITGDETSLLLGVCNDTWVESVLRRSVQVENLLFNTGDAENDRSWHCGVSFNLGFESVNVCEFW